MLLIGVVSIVLYFGFFKEKLTQRNTPTIAQIQNKPPLSKEAQQIKQMVVSKPITKQGNFGILIDNSNYQLGYAPTPDAFFVSFYSQDVEKYDLYNQEIENWLLEKGFVKEDLCNLIVIYSISSNLRLLNFKEALPSCSS